MPIDNMTIDPAALRHRLDFAVDTARAAGERILTDFRRADLHVELKRDATPVTEADRGAEELIRERISATFPQDGILGEEFGDRPSENGFRWILDPIDGTKSFIHGVPLFGTLIGLEYQTQVVVGVCRFPALDEIVYAATGLGCWWQIANSEPKRAQVSRIDQLAQALVCTTTITGWQKMGVADVFDTVCQLAGLVRTWGDCYGHILVATGRAEVMIDPAMNPWDAAALVPILQESGGRFLDWDGNVSIYSNNGVSVNSQLADVVLSILRSRCQ